MSPQVVVVVGFFFFFEAIRRESPPLEKNANKHKRDETKMKRIEGEKRGGIFPPETLE